MGSKVKDIITPHPKAIAELKDVVEQVHETITSHPEEKKSVNLQSLKEHLKDFLTARIEATSTSEREKAEKRKKIGSLFHAVTQQLKDGNVPKTKDEKSDALKSFFGHMKEYIEDKIEATSSSQAEKD